MLGILKLFYNNNEDIKKGEENKQLIDLRNFPNLGNVVLTLTPIILRTGDFYETEDKNYKINLFISRKTVNLMLYNRLLIK